MAVIKPFKCIRPAKEYASSVAALPYDVYSREEACEEVKDKPLSFLNIDRAETQQKIRYLINATRCLLADFIDRPTYSYFRLCHAITHTLEEDLLFLKEHIKEKDLPYSTYTQGLLTVGLMYQSVLDGNGEQKYSFTPVARLVDRFAVSYDDVERYPNPQSHFRCCVFRIYFTIDKIKRNDIGKYNKRKTQLRGGNSERISKNHSQI